MSKYKENFLNKLLKFQRFKDTLYSTYWQNTMHLNVGNVLGYS